MKKIQLAVLLDKRAMQKRQVIVAESSPTNMRQSHYSVCTLKSMCNVLKTQKQVNLTLLLPVNLCLTQKNHQLTFLVLPLF